MTEQVQQRSRGSAIAMVIALMVIVGGALGAISGTLGISPVILFAVMFPPLYLLVWPRIIGRGTLAASTDLPQPGTIRTTLLEDTARWRRLVQVVVPVVGTLVATVGVALLVRREGADNAWAGPAAVVGVVAIVASLVLPITWDLMYKGHRIRFQNYPCIPERLFIDGVLVDRGGIGMHMLLRGTIAGGEGAGDRVIVRSYAGLAGFSCRIVAESDTHAPSRSTVTAV